MRISIVENWKKANTFKIESEVYYTFIFSKDQRLVKILIPCLLLFYKTIN